MIHLNSMGFVYAVQMFGYASNGGMPIRGRLVALPLTPVDLCWTLRLGDGMSITHSG